MNQKKSNQQLTNHDFNFEGGEKLSKMGASWFISYLYHIKVDPEHQNWAILKTHGGRRSVFEQTEKEYTTKGVPMHVHYVKQICSMSASCLSTNRIQIPGNRVIDMAEELLNCMNSHH